MKHGKFQGRAHTGAKSLAVLLTLTLLLGCAIGGTVAWLLDSTGPITNTFTTSDITVTLAETKTDFQMVPGHTIEKDPKATVAAGSEDCYLFVKVVESTTVDTYLSYTIAEGWTKLDGITEANTEVYYRVFDSKDSTNTNAKGTAYSVLANDRVNVLSTVTKEMMAALEAEDAVQPTLTFTAYAAQLYKDNTNRFTAAEAWNLVKDVAANP